MGALAKEPIIVGYHKSVLLSRFRAKTMYWIESGARGYQIFETRLDCFKITANIHIGRIVFLEDVIVVDKYGTYSKVNSQILFNLFNSSTIGKLTDRLELLNALSKQNQKEVHKQAKSLAL